MTAITDLAALQALYPDPPSGLSLKKVASRITPAYAKWIAASRFCILSTVGPEGTDSSPRGDDGPVVLQLDPQTLALPDWRGNNRMDSLRNIVRDGRVSLLFLVPGSTNVVRVNGTAILTAESGLTARFDRNGKHPRSVTLITVAEVYFQCAKAILRAGLWARGDDGRDLPTAGDFLREADADFDGKTYDATYPDKARPLMW